MWLAKSSDRGVLFSIVCVLFNHQCVHRLQCLLYIHSPSSLSHCLNLSPFAIFQTKKYRSKGGLIGPDGSKSVFGQVCSKMSNFGSDSLLLPHRVWKVKFIGESVDDCGGGYSESIAEMCDELQNGSLPLLIVTPNGREESGANRDCFILNPEACSPVHLNMFKFLGVLIGIAIRTGSPLSLNLAEPVWQQLAGEEFHPSLVALFKNV